MRLFRAMTLQPNLAHQPKTDPISDAEFSYIFSSSDDRNEKGLRVSIHNMQSARTSSRQDAPPIVDDSAVVLESSGRFLHVGSAAIAQGDDPAAGPDADPGESKDAAEKGVTNETGFNVALALVKKQGAVPMMIHRVNISQVSDVMVGVAAVPHMRNAIDMLIASSKKLAQPGKEFEATSRKVRNMFREFGAVPHEGRPGGILQKLTNFVCANDSLDQDFDYGDLQAKVNKLSRAGSDPKLAASHARRQSLMREQGIIMMLLEALEVVMKSCEKVAALHGDHGDDDGSVKSGKSRGSHHKRSKRDSPVDFWLKLREELSTPVFWMLYISLHRAPANQLHAADQLTTMIAYVPHDIVATKCIVHMLSTNMDVQESKVGADDVAKFIAMIREAPMDASYLTLLMSVCSCGGAGVDGNQCRVADMWLDEARDYHIEIGPAAKSQPHKIEWCRALPEKKKLHAYIKGYSLIEDGIPELALHWVTKRDDLSVSAVAKLCNQMDGKLSISSLAVGQRERSQAIAGTPVGSSSGSFRATVDPAAEAARTITDYLVAQLYLAAEICLDRNYVAISRVSESMPYETCIAILHDKDVPNRVKAAVIRLINTVYLDADPMIEKRVPRLSHPWSVIAVEDVALPCIKEEYQHSFYLVQVRTQARARASTHARARS